MSLKDISMEMLTFKEAIRHLWNTTFVADGQRASFEGVGAYQEISDRLFAELILERLDLPGLDQEYGMAPVPSILVVPIEGLTELPVMRNDDSDQRGAWHSEELYPVERFGACEFIEFFSWDTFTFVDMPLVRCRSPRENCEYLVQQHHCRFAMVDPD